MKRFLFLILLSASMTAAHAQTVTETESYGLDAYIEKCTDLPVVRNVNGGTVFHITYEGNWDNAMKGAFEYACKIWEEQIPNNFPINITAKIGSIRGRGTGKLLSKVMSTSYNGWSDSNETSLSSRIKYVVLEEYNTGNSYHYVDFIPDSSFFQKPDIVITYNKDMMDEFSYSLYTTPVDKYDFVTVVLRDIARGLGFASGFTANTDKKTFNVFDGKPLTPYEGFIMSAIGTKDPAQAYANATDGTLGIQIPNYGHLTLYAPAVWQNGVSLNSLVSDSTKKISELLSYDFGKGSVIRDITDNYNLLFDYLHGWKADNVTTGYSGRSVSSSGSTANLIAYDGDISIGTEDNYSGFENMPLAVQSATSQDNVNSSFDISSYCFPYDYKYPDVEGLGAWVVSLLKKDGTWDVVYKQETSLLDIPLHVSVRDLIVNSNPEVYQRTCDGYLRCRITRYKEVYDSFYRKTKYNIQTAYYVLDYLPQQVDMALAPIKNEMIQSSTTTHLGENGYTKDVDITIKGLEGVERVVVEQLDEGNDMPEKYEVKDFKKGFFTATVDKKLHTYFTIYSYNKNGSAKSKTLTVSPFLIPIDIAIKNEKDFIDIVPANEKQTAEILGKSYDIHSVSSNQNVSVQSSSELHSNRIDISALPKGFYVLNIKDIMGGSHEFKFVR